MRHAYRHPSYYAEPPVPTPRGWSPPAEEEWVTYPVPGPYARKPGGYARGKDLTLSIWNPPPPCDPALYAKTSEWLERRWTPGSPNRVGWGGHGHGGHPHPHGRGGRGRGGGGWGPRGYWVEEPIYDLDDEDWDDDLYGEDPVAAAAAAAPPAPEGGAKPGAQAKAAIVKFFKKKDDTGKTEAQHVAEQAVARVLPPAAPPSPPPVPQVNYLHVGLATLVGLGVGSGLVYAAGRRSR